MDAIGPGRERTAAQVGVVVLADGEDGRPAAWASAIASTPS